MKTQITLALALFAALSSVASAQDAVTPPVAPQVRETSLPPAVTLPAPAGEQAVSKPLTAAEACRIALQRQASLVSARGSALAALGRLQQARAGLLPALSVTAGYTDTDTMSGEGATGGSNGSPGYQASATVRQLVFDFQHTRDLTHQAAEAARSAQHSVSRAESDLVLQVKQAFYALAQASRLVSVNETNVRNAQSHLALAQARLKTGLGLPSDVVRAETAVSEAVLGLTAARTTASVSAVALANLMGVDPRTPLTAADSAEPPITTDDVNSLVDTALLRRPDVLQAEAALAAAAAGLRAARTSGAPALAATAGVAAKDTTFPMGNSSLMVGATLQWSLLDAGATAGRTREAQGSLQTAEANLALARQTATADVAQAYLNLRSAEQRVTTAEAEVANAEEGVRLAEGRYRSGLGTFLEVTDAQSALLAAHTNGVNARAQVDIARAALAHAIGDATP